MNRVLYRGPAFMPTVDEANVSSVLLCLLLTILSVYLRIQLLPMFKEKDESGCCSMRRRASMSEN